jgi:hypothetical protein
VRRACVGCWRAAQEKKVVARIGFSAREYKRLALASVGRRANRRGWRSRQLLVCCARLKLALASVCWRVGTRVGCRRAVLVWW